MNQFSQFFLDHWPLWVGFVVLLILVFINKRFTKKTKAKEITPQISSNNEAVLFTNLLDKQTSKNSKKRTTHVVNSGRLPKRVMGDSSILMAETKAMDRSRRLAEQQGERRLAAVKARNHSNEEQLQQTPEGELQNNILQHPELDNQRFDGVDPNLNPEPPLNSEARREYDNEKREQDKEKQLRLGNMPQYRTDPRPNGPY